MPQKRETEVVADFGKVQVRLSVSTTNADPLTEPTKVELAQVHADLIEIFSRWNEFARSVK